MYWRQRRIHLHASILQEELVKVQQKLEGDWRNPYVCHTQEQSQFARFASVTRLVKLPVVAKSEVKTFKQSNQIYNGQLTQPLGSLLVADGKRLPQTFSLSSRRWKSIGYGSREKR